MESTGMGHMRKVEGAVVWVYLENSFHLPSLYQSLPLLLRDAEQKEKNRIIKHYIIYTIYSIKLRSKLIC